MCQILPISHQYVTYISSKSRPYFSHLNLGNIWKSRPPPLCQNSLHFELWTFWFSALTPPPPLWTFPKFCDIFNFDGSPKKLCLTCTTNSNYKGQGPTKSCILCGNHSDLQELCFSCPVILQNIKITGKYQNIFHTTISTTLAKNLLEITELRSKEQAVPARVPIVHHLVTPTDGCCKPSHNHVV